MVMPSDPFAGLGMPAGGYAQTGQDRTPPESIDNPQGPDFDRGGIAQSDPNAGYSGVGLSEKAGVGQQMVQDAIAHNAALTSGALSRDSTSVGYNNGPGLNGPVLPNGMPDQTFDRRLGGPTGRPGVQGQPATGGPIDPRTGQPWEKNTAEFYAGAYTPGKGVADKDGYFDERYMSEKNIMDNARRGDPAALAKLEVMAAGGNKDAALISTDLGTRFGQTQIAADFLPQHNAEINKELAGGAFNGNREARQNLADQRMNPQAGVLSVQQSNPQAYDMMRTIADLGGRKVDFGPGGISWVDTAGDAHRVAIGEIAQRAPELQAIADAHKKTQ